MKQMDWSEEHQQGLVQNVHPDLQRYLDTRHLVKPKPKSSMVLYTEPEQSTHSPAPYASKSEAAVELIVAVGKPLVVLSAVGGVVCVIVSGAVAVVGAVFAFVSAYALYIGGGVFAVSCLVLAVFGAKGSGESAAPSGGASGGQTINVTVNVAGQTVNANSK